MGPSWSDGEAVIAQYSMHVYLYPIKGGSVGRSQKNKVSGFAENTASETFSELPVLQLKGGTPQPDSSWNGLALGPRSVSASSSALAQSLPVLPFSISYQKQ